MKTARRWTGRGVSGVRNATSNQSLIPSRTNGPGPKDVAMVGVTVRGCQLHGPGT